MLRVKISELKNQLSRYLRAVRQGEIVEVLDRDVAVAVIHPVSGHPAGGSHPTGGQGKKEDLEFFAEQFRLGVLRKGTGKIPPELFQLPPGKPGVLAALITERREGR